MAGKRRKISCPPVKPRGKGLLGTGSYGGKKHQEAGQWDWGGGGGNHGAPRELGQSIYPGGSRELLKVIEQWSGMVSVELEVTGSAQWAGQGCVKGPHL